MTKKKTYWKFGCGRKVRGVCGSFIGVVSGCERCVDWGGWYQKGRLKRNERWDIENTEENFFENGVTAVLAQ